MQFEQASLFVAVEDHGDGDSTSMQEKRWVTE